MIAIVLCIIILVLVYVLYITRGRKTIKIPVEKKKDLPEAVSFLLDEMNSSSAVNYQDLKDQLDIILQNTYIFDENVIGLKLKE